MFLRDFQGNPVIVNLLRSGQVPQTSLFTGPEGVGKKTLALAVAARANCERPEEGDICGRCASCLKALSANHPDIRIITPEKNIIRIDAMREMSREAQFRPFEGKLRFFIIDAADRMTEEAANSILKTLEEPPPTTRLILVTTFPGKLLATIRSRCQTFTFRNLARVEIERILATKYSGEELQLRAAFADGSMARALTLDPQQEVKERDEMLALLEEWFSKRSYARLFKVLEEPPFKGQFRSRDFVMRRLEVLQQLIEDVYSLQIGREGRVVNFDCKKRLSTLSQALTMDELMDFLYHVGRSRWQVDHYVNPLIAFESLWLRSTDAGNRYRQV